MRKFLLTFGLIAGAALFGLGLNPAKAAAVTASDWQADRIMDDAVFFNPNTMSSPEIQNFLNAKVPSCDTNGSQPSGHSGFATRADWGRANGAPPPYTCLKDYSQNVPDVAADAYCGPISGGNLSAASVIKIVSAACSVNPQALLVTLQKEQSIITDDWPWPRQYQAAMGYGCPDTASCDPQFAGFFNQVYYGARQFQRYAKQSQNYNYRAGVTSFVAYNPNSGCGGTVVAISNQATAGLYNYTPYQPNQAALNNMYGTGDGCSAYGNRNFWRQFWDWFGNPIGSEYAWLIDSFTYSGGDNLVGVGQTKTLTLKARNVSRHPWYSSGDHPIRLGTWQPPDHPSQLLNGGTRYANLQESQVDPNSVGTFTFQITPNTMGTYVEPMNLVVENYTWMSWPGLSPPIVVTNGYQWQIDSVIYGNGTGVMDPGTSQLITVKARNTGNVTWNKSGGNPVRLGTWEPGRASAVGNGWLSSTRPADMNESSVAPGAVAGFQFNVRVPSGGNFYEQLNLVAEGLTWFNNPGLTLYLHGKNFAWQPLWSSLSTGNPNIGQNQTFDVTLKARNTGETTWTKGGSYPVRLGTASPLNRGSGLFYSNWINDTRPAALIEDSVPPGSDGTFTFTAHTPNSPGGRNEYFNLVAEGLAWASDPLFSIYVNVQ